MTPTKIQDQEWLPPANGRRRVVLLVITGMHNIYFKRVATPVSPG